MVTRVLYDRSKVIAARAKAKVKRGRRPTVNLRAGQKFGYLELLQRVRTKDGKTTWRCKCVCDLRLNIPASYLTRKQYPARSCGCRKFEHANPWKREKGIWNMMHQRTENPNHISYPHYGAKGIRVCPEWHKSLPDDAGWHAFIAHIGPAPTNKHSIDRIDPFRGYEPGNVRWATSKEQALNQRRHQPTQSEESK